MLLPDAPESEILVLAGHPAAGVRTIARTLACVATHRGESVRLVMPGEEPEPDAMAHWIVAAAPALADVQARARLARDAGRRLALVAIANGGPDELALTYAAIKAAADHAVDIRIVVAPNRTEPDRARRSAHAVAFACSRYLDRDAEVSSPLPHEPTLSPALDAGVPLSDVIAGTPLERAAGTLWTVLTSTARRAAATT